MKKVTKKENFKTIIEILEDLGKKELVEVMQHEIDLIEKKASKSKLTATQKANEDIKDLIVKELKRIGKAVSITELLTQSKAVSEAVGNSNQKASALMTQLKNAELVVREQDGKKATFRVATEDDFAEVEDDEEVEE